MSKKNVNGNRPSRFGLFIYQKVWMSCLFFERIHGMASDDDTNNERHTLFGFVAGEEKQQIEGIPYAFIDYLELVDYSLPSMALTLRAS